MSLSLEMCTKIFTDDGNQIGTLQMDPEKLICKYVIISEKNFKCKNYILCINSHLTFSRFRLVHIENSGNVTYSWKLFASIFLLLDDVN